MSVVFTFLVSRDSRFSDEDADLCVLTTGIALFCTSTGILVGIVEICAGGETLVRNRKYYDSI